MFQRLFAPRAAIAAGRALYAPLISQARSPVFYTAGAVPDTTDGRFEIYTLHLALVLRRLRGEGEMAAEVSQMLFDTFLSGLDDGLREMGVGDLSVGKKMRKLGEAIYGRLKSYDEALKADASPDALVHVLERTVYLAAPNAPAERLADYVRRTDAALTAADLSCFMNGAIPWTEASL